MKSYFQDLKDVAVAHPHPHSSPSSLSLATPSRPKEHTAREMWVGFSHSGSLRTKEVELQRKQQWKVFPKLPSLVEKMVSGFLQSFSFLFFKGIDFGSKGGTLSVSLLPTDAHRDHKSQYKPEKNFQHQTSEDPGTMQNSRAS